MVAKYQIFVSSTFEDLKEERNLISRSILDLGQIPAGMELFPAADIDQFSYIKKVIDECDYYLLIIGGRYGSLSGSGVSFTELEYEYAVQQKKPVLAFIKNEIEQIATEKKESDSVKIGNLMRFREKVSQGRLVQFWDSLELLQAKAITSLARAFQDNPQTGWVRADQVASAEVLNQLINVQNENKALSVKIQEFEQASSKVPENLAGLDSIFRFRFKKYESYHGRGGYYPQEEDLSLREFFISISRKYQLGHTMEVAGSCIEEHLNGRRGVKGKFSQFDMTDIEAAMLQLVGLKLLTMYNSKTTTNTFATFFSLTPNGNSLWLELTLRRSAE